MKQGERFFRDEPAKYMAVHSQHVLRGYKVDAVGTEWRLITKITDRRGNKLISFIQAGTIYDCWQYLYLHYTTTNTPLRWSTDKWA